MKAVGASRTNRQALQRDERNARMVALLESARGGSEQQWLRAVQRVVLEYRDVADAVANRFRTVPQDHRDVQQVAYVGLVKAVRRFTPARGCDIVSFAVPTITGEIKRYFRDSGWMVRPPRALQELDGELRATVGSLGQTLGRQPSVDEICGVTGLHREQVLEGLRCADARHPVSLDGPARREQHDAGQITLGDTLPCDEEGFAHAELAVAIAEACRELSDRDRKILHMRFVQECTQDEIARECRVTQMQISRLLTRILAELRTRLSPDLLAA